LFYKYTAGFPLNNDINVTEENQSKDKKEFVAPYADSPL